MFILKAYASGGAGGRGTGGGPSGRGYRTMSQYYRGVGTSRMGATARTRGRSATITPVRGR